MSVLNRYLIFSILLLLSVFLGLFYYFDSIQADIPENPKRMYYPDGQLINFGVIWNEGAGLEISGIILSEEVKSDDDGEYIEIYTLDQVSNNNINIKAYLNELGIKAYAPSGVIPEEQPWTKYTYEEINNALIENTQILLRASKITEDEYLQFKDKISSSSKTTIFGVNAITLIR